MKIYIKLIILSFFLLIIIPNTGWTAVDLPWSTTYDCPEWELSDNPHNPNPGCDGLTRARDSWTCGHGEQITTEANYSEGGGGRGQRHWMADGTNKMSGGMSVYFNQDQPELWIRWYMRFQDEWEWSGAVNNFGLKVFYFDMGQPSSLIFDIQYPDQLRIRSHFGGGAYDQTGYGWNNIMQNGSTDDYGRKRSDGAFHCYELHLKMDTNGNNGVAQIWIDGALVYDRSDLDLGTAISGWNYISFPQNGRGTNNGVDCGYIDIDDMVINNTGYIGPLQPIEPDNIQPSVSITSPSSGQTVSGDVTISATASDNVGVAGLQFKLDGNNIGTEGTTSPYLYTLDTTLVSNGSHFLTATARDSAGNQKTSDSLSITVNNNNDSSEILFEEFFDNANFASKGWYDNTNLTISTTEHIPGSAGSVEFQFNQGATAPTSGSAIRKKFSETDEVYVSYYVKYSSNFVGSATYGGEHEIQMLTNVDSDWSSLAYAHLTTYIEQVKGVPLLQIQDGANIDESNIGVGLVNITEQRSVAGCNGDSDGYGNGTCYLSGSVHWNFKQWKANSVYFNDSPGQYYKNDWHFIEIYIKLNSIQNGKGIANGVLKYWYDGNLIIDHNNVMLRTGQYPDMKFNQFVIAPWMGEGSPVDQTFWIDDLTVATSKITTQSPPDATTVGFGN